MPYRPTYCWNTEESNGHEPADILIQLYPDEAFRSIVLRKEDFERLRVWELCQLLQQAREAGYRDAQRDIRNALDLK